MSTRHFLNTINRNTKFLNLPFVDTKTLFFLILNVLIFGFAIMAGLFAMPIGRSFWYDEYNIAYHISTSSLFEIFTNELYQNYGRMPGYSILSKIVSLFYNDPISFRIMNLVPLGIIFSISIYFIYKKKFLFTTLLSVFILISDNFASMLTTYKPYIFDVASGYVAILLILKFSENREVKDLTSLVFVLSIMALFSHFIWPLLPIIFIAYALQNRDLFSRGAMSGFYQLTARYLRRPSIGISAALIWVYLLQHVLRAVLFGDDSVTYSYVRDVSRDAPTNIFQHIVTFGLLTYDNFSEFASMRVSEDMPFLLNPNSTTSLPFFVFMFWLASFFCKDRPVIILSSFSVISYLMHALVDWPYDGERWSMGLNVLLSAPAFLLLAKLLHRRLLMGSVIVMTLAVMQTPWNSHANGSHFWDSRYQFSRLHPSTSTEEMVQMANDWALSLAPHDRPILVATRNAYIGILYYTDHAAGREYTALNRLDHIEFHPERLDEFFPQLESGSTYLIANTHSFRWWDAFADEMSTRCEVIDELENDTWIGDVRLLRVTLLLVRC